MYEFKARLPVDYGMELVAIIREGRLVSDKEQVLMEVGAISGEMGAWLLSLKVAATDPVPFATLSHEELPTTVEQCCTELEQQLSGDAAQANPAIVALLMKLLELVIQRLLNA